MCTVTFVRTASEIIITSNRDEQIDRPAAIPPEPYDVGNKKLIFPKDPKAGGTWFVTDNAGNMCVLLNGAAQKHEFRNHWRKSRGLILLELAASRSFFDAWNEIDLYEIEPFTIVCYSNGELTQVRWDGNVKEKLSLDPAENYIWSSSPLYTMEVRELRSRLFSEFLQAEDSDIMDFHLKTNQNPDESIAIDRGFLKTLSVTQARISSDHVSIAYLDLGNSNKTNLSLQRDR